MPPDALFPETVVGVGAADEAALADSPVGPVWIAWSVRGVTALSPVFASKSFEDFSRSHRRTAFERDALPADLGDAVVKALDTGNANDVPIDLSGVRPFQQRVLAACSTIPAGEVKPYQWIAVRIDKPAAARAVGTALARNPIPLLVPCHRVVRADGSVGSYAFGAQRKRDLLIREGALLH